MKQGFEVVVIGAVGIDTNVYISANSVDFVLEASFTKNLDYIGMAGGYSSKGFAGSVKKQHLSGLLAMIIWEGILLVNFKLMELTQKVFFLIRWGQKEA